MSLPEGYEQQVARALTERVMMGGVPRTMAIMEGGLVASLVFAVGPSRMLVWLIPSCALVHWFLVTLYYRDPYAGESWVAYLKQPARLDV